MGRKPTPPVEPQAWSLLDDVDYDEDFEGANPMPDEDGNIVLKRKEPERTEERHGKKKGGRRQSK